MRQKVAIRRCQNLQAFSNKSLYIKVENLNERDLNADEKTVQLVLKQ
jgi:hypothetical protein